MTKHRARLHDVRGAARRAESGSRADFERGPLPAGQGHLSREAARPNGAPANSPRIRRAHFIETPEDQRLFEATRAIVVAARAWRKFTNEQIKPLNQTMARWETLFHVAVGGEDLTQRELAGVMGIEGPSLVRMLDRLARDGLIERRQNHRDRRVTNNRITPRGLETVRQIMSLTNVIRADVLREIDPVRLSTCVEVLEEIIARVESREPEPDTR